MTNDGALLVVIVTEGLILVMNFIECAKEFEERFGLWELITF